MGEQSEGGQEVRGRDAQGQEVAEARQEEKESKEMSNLKTITMSLYLGAGSVFGAIALLFGVMGHQPVWQDIVMTVYATVAWPLLIFCNGLCPFPGWWNIW